jgi:transposase-like protein
MPHATPRETKEKILLAIKDEGLSVSDAATLYSVAANTIYGWMGTGAKNGHTSALEFQKLKKENDMLKMLIGALTLENEKVKKNPLRS